MIVDLMRNDLARVCAQARCAVRRLLFEVEPWFCLVPGFDRHRASWRRAAPRSTCSAAAFPPGSVTGAPKVEAMKLIAALEPPRGPFFGSVFWSEFDGAGLRLQRADPHRRVRRRRGGGWRFEARAGAGIVADSDPVAERRETEAKISAILAALGA